MYDYALLEIILIFNPKTHLNKTAAIEVLPNKHLSQQWR